MVTCFPWASGRARRRDAALLAWLRANPDSESMEAAVALGRPARRTHHDLVRLEAEGRVQSGWNEGDVFNHLVYRVTGETA